MKNATRPTSTPAAALLHRQPNRDPREPGWDARPVREHREPAERPDPVDRIPFTRDAADHWLR